MKKKLLTKSISCLALAGICFIGSIFSPAKTQAATISGSHTSSTHALVGTSGEIGSFNTYFYLRQDYKTSGSNRVYGYRTAFISYTAYGNITPNFVAKPKLCYVDSSLNTLKTFTWSSLDSIYGAEQTYVTSVQNSKSVTYPKNNSNYFLASVVIGNSDAIYPYYTDSYKLALKS